MLISCFCANSLPSASSIGISCSILSGIGLCLWLRPDSQSACQSQCGNYESFSTRQHVRTCTMLPALQKGIEDASNINPTQEGRVRSFSLFSNTFEVWLQDQRSTEDAPMCKLLSRLLRVSRTLCTNVQLQCTLAENCDQLDGSATTLSARPTVQSCSRKNNCCRSSRASRSFACCRKVCVR